MIPVFQIEHRLGLGDCMRACLASIFEFPLGLMPNYWEQTQDTEEYWKLTNQWLSENYGYVCISISMVPEHQYLLKDILCVAVAKCGREEHAVVWKNGLIHNPSIGGHPFPEKAEHFIFLTPLDPLKKGEKS